MYNGALQNLVFYGINVNMKNERNIKIIEHYLAKKIKNGDLIFRTERKWEVRPAWIKIIRSSKPLSRFALIDIPKTGNVIYRAFGHYFIPYDYTGSEEKRFMDAMAKDYDKMVAGKFNIPMAKALSSKLPLKKVDKNAHILDLGCGTGIMTELLSKEGFSNFTLVDFSKNMLAQAKKKLRGIEKIKYECMDITKKLPKGKFDVVLSVMLLNTFNEKITDSILSRLVRQMPQKALFGVLEDSKKSSYAKYFNPIIDKIFDTGLRNKYIFIGIKK